MYSLDINFLKDRGLDTPVATESTSVGSSSSLGDKLPLIGGGVLAFILPAIMFLYAQSFDAKKADSEQEIQNIDTETAKIQGQSKSFEELEAQVKKAGEETTALVSVFSKIRPWSAILKEIGNITPPGVQISSIKQNGIGDNITVRIDGTARSFAEVNDFILFLQGSTFFDSNQIVLGSTNIAGIPINIENQKDLPKNIIINIPQGVKYNITAKLANMPTAVLVKELNKKGSVGLITRLKTLESKGVETK